MSHRNDEIGSQCQSLWEKYFISYSQFPKENNYNNNNMTKEQQNNQRIVESKFENFASYFISTFNLSDQNTTTEVIAEVQGHPTIVIEHIIHLFLAELNVTIIDNNTKKATQKSASAWFADSSHKDTIFNGSAKVSMPTKYFISSTTNHTTFDMEKDSNSSPTNLGGRKNEGDFRNIKQENKRDEDVENEDQSEQQQIRIEMENILLNQRKQFLLIIFLMSSLLRWPHNQAVVLSKYGYTFATIVVGVIQSLSDIIEDCVRQWSYYADMSTSQQSDIQSTSKFLLTCIFGLSQIYVNDGVTTPQSEMQSKNIILPFTLKSIRDIWSMNILELNPLSGNVYEEDIIRSPTNASTSTSTIYASSPTASSASFMNLNASPVSSIKSISLDKSEHSIWNMESVMLGFIEQSGKYSSIAIFSSLLRKLCLLSTLFNDRMSNNVNINENNNNSNSNSNILGNLTSKMENMDLYFWRLILLIQIDILSTFWKVSKCRCNDFLNSYSTHSANYALQAIMSFRDVPNQLNSLSSDIGIQDANNILVNIRAMLCLFPAQWDPKLGIHVT